MSLQNVILFLTVTDIHA